jgi:hypothetical protein
LQVTTHKLLLFSQSGEKLAEVILPEGISQIGKDLLIKNDSIFLQLASGEIKAFSSTKLEPKF